MEKDFFHEARYLNQDGEYRTTKVPVVQELAHQGLHHLPERFIAVHRIPSSELDHPPNTLLSISLSNLRSTSEPKIRNAELDKLGRGVKDWGMFLVADHEISSSVLKDVKDVVKCFFSMSFEEKKASVGSYASVDNMGYGRNFVKSEDQKLDWIDRIAMKAAPKGISDGLHVWPQTPTNFRVVIEKYVEEARRVCDELLQYLAAALSLEEHAFLRHFDPNTSHINVRINYYPPCPQPDLALGLAPHSDASALTFLLQFDKTGGLQVMQNAKWLTVPWPEDALLVNAGDLMEIMSYGKIISPWHRVVTQKDVERFSVALFYNPPVEAEIEPVRDEIENEKHYKKVRVKDYIDHYYSISPTQEKLAIKFSKVCGA